MRKHSPWRIAEVSAEPRTHVDHARSSVHKAFHHTLCTTFGLNVCSFLPKQARGDIINEKMTRWRCTIDTESQKSKRQLSTMKPNQRQICRTIYISINTKSMNFRLKLTYLCCINKRDHKQLATRS